MTATPMQSQAEDITELLQLWRDGSQEALEAIIPRVYAELRALAAAQLRRERRGHSLQPTALVNEAYLRLVRRGGDAGSCRRHFFAASAQIMRRVLVEHARRRLAQKRGGGAHLTVTLNEDGVPHGAKDPEILDVHRGLEELAAIHQRQAKLVELRYFGGLTISETADTLGISPATAERDWTAARLWLWRRLAAMSDD